MSAIYSYSLSRLGRSLPELSRLVADCAARGIPVRLVTDHLDTSTATGRFLANTLTNLAQLEAELASERVTAAYAVRRAAGNPIRNGRRYGDRKGEDIEIVLNAFREAGSFAGTARLLNERQIPPRNAVRRKIRQLDGTITERAAWWPGSVAAIVRRLDPSIPRGIKGSKAGGVGHTLSRLLKCPTCGTTMVGVADRRRGKTRVRYICRMPDPAHRRVTISEHLILPAVQAEAERLVTPEQLVGTADGRLRQELEERRSRVFDMYESGDLDRDEYRRRVDAIDTETASLDAKRVVAAIPRLDWTWEPQRINTVLRAMFERIELDPETFQPVAFDWTVPEWRAAE